MALILCHRCLSWVEPFADQCPQCDYPLDTRVPDPPLAQLAAIIGQFVGKIGEVRIARDGLPSFGTLYETTQGLFFVPHRLEQVKLCEADRQTRWQSVLSAILPARLSALWRSRRPRARLIQTAVDKPRPLSAGDSDQLPLLLMQNPGVFFLSQRDIRKIRRTFSSWTVLRQNHMTLKLKPTSDREEFHQRMSDLAANVREVAYT